MTGDDEGLHEFKQTVEWRRDTQPGLIARAIEIARRAVLEEGCHSLVVERHEGGATITGQQGEGARYLIEKNKQLGGLVADLTERISHQREGVPA